MLPNKIAYVKEGAFKYFIGYIINGIKPLCINLPQMNEYAKYFDKKNKYMNLLVYDKELLNEYNAKWNKISNLLKVEFDSDPVTQLNINFHCNKTPEEN